MHTGFLKISKPDYSYTIAEYSLTHMTPHIESNSRLSNLLLKLISSNKLLDLLQYQIVSFPRILPSYHNVYLMVPNITESKLGKLLIN